MLRGDQLLRWAAGGKSNYTVTAKKHCRILKNKSSKPKGCGRPQRGIKKREKILLWSYVTLFYTIWSLCPTCWDSKASAGVLCKRWSLFQCHWVHTRLPLAPSDDTLGVAFHFNFCVLVCFGVLVVFSPPKSAISCLILLQIKFAETLFKVCIPMTIFLLNCVYTKLFKWDSNATLCRPWIKMPWPETNFWDFLERRAKKFVPI